MAWIARLRWNSWGRSSRAMLKTSMLGATEFGSSNAFNYGMASLSYVISCLTKMYEITRCGAIATSSWTGAHQGHMQKKLENQVVMSLSKKSSRSSWQNGSHKTGVTKQAGFTYADFFATVRRRPNSHRIGKSSESSPGSLRANFWLSCNRVKNRRVRIQMRWAFDSSWCAKQTAT